MEDHHSQWVNQRTKWAIFNSELLVYQRVNIFAMFFSPWNSRANNKKTIVPNWWGVRKHPEYKRIMDENLWRCQKTSILGLIFGIPKKTPKRTWGVCELSMALDVCEILRQLGCLIVILAKRQDYNRIIIGCSSTNWRTNNNYLW